MTTHPDPTAGSGWEGFERAVESGAVSMRDVSHHTTQVFAAATERRRRTDSTGALVVTRHGQMVGVITPATIDDLVGLLSPEDAKDALAALMSGQTRHISGLPARAPGRN